MKLERRPARAALVREIGEPLGLDLARGGRPASCASPPQMANVVRRVTTERGLDARDFAIASPMAAPVRYTPSWSRANSPSAPR